MEALAASPFARDPDCLAHAIRIMKADASVARGRLDNERLRQCERDGKGLDLGCFINKFLPDEFAELGRCWKRNPSHDVCAREIFKACGKMHSEWSALLLRGR